METLYFSILKNQWLPFNRIHPLRGAFLGRNEFDVPRGRKTNLGRADQVRSRAFTRLQPTLPADFLEHKKDFEFLVSWEKKSLDCHDVWGTLFSFYCRLNNFKECRSIEFQDIFLKTPGCLLKPPSWRLETQRESILGVCFLKSPAVCLLNYTLQACWFRAASFLVRKKPNLYRKHTN